MKKSKELNVDIIGGQAPLTKQEEKMISDFLQSRSIKKPAPTRKTAAKRKSAA